MGGGIKGYKVFDPDWTCGGFQYRVGEIFEEDVMPLCDIRGFHFYPKASDCFSYYGFNSNNKVAEVIALGDVEYAGGGTRCCTNKIQIVREIPWRELLAIANKGNDCTGFRNVGDHNAGSRNIGSHNAGNRNAGNWNAGDWNIGSYNTGNRNAGSRNTGDWNTGNYNAGDCNAGSWNTGDWNKSSFNTGCFMTEEQKIFLFNKPSDWTYEDWLLSDAKRLLNQIQSDAVKWVFSTDMTDEEKAEHPEHETTGGYLKMLNRPECGQIWWDGLSECERDVIRGLPNFDAAIFEQCTGIKV